MKRTGLPTSLVAAVLLMTLVVLGLGGAVVALKLRPAGAPATAAQRDLEQWQRAVDANPKDPQAQVGLGLALAEAGRGGDAKGAFETALRLDPNNWMAQFQLGLLERASDPARAEQLLASAGAHASPGDKADPYVALGDLRLAQHRAEAARSAYRRAVIDAPYLFDAHLGLARALEALGDRQGALRHYRDAQRFDPKNQMISQAIARLQGMG